MGNGDDGALPFDGAQSTENDGFVDDIEVIGDFIHDNQIRVDGQSPGDADALDFSAGELLSGNGPIQAAESRDQRGQVAEVDKLVQAGVGDGLVAEGDVVLQAAVEDGCELRDVARACEMAQESSSLALQGAENEADEGAFAFAVTAEDGVVFAGVNFPIEMIEDAMAAVVGKADVVQLNQGGRCFRCRRLGRFGIQGGVGIRRGDESEGQLEGLRTFCSPREGWDDEDKLPHLPGNLADQHRVGDDGTGFHCAHQVQDDGEDEAC